MEKSFLLLGSFLVVIGLANFAALWFVYARLTRRMDELETLINSLGDIVGAYIDAMEGDGK